MRRALKLARSTESVRLASPGSCDPGSGERGGLLVFVLLNKKRAQESKLFCGVNYDTGLVDLQTIQALASREAV